MNPVHSHISEWIDLARRAWFKLVAGRLRYGRRQGYAADRYWTDRFRKYGTSLRGPGHEGRSESENQQEYANAGRRFEEACQLLSLDLPHTRVLEVGCGTGFYTRVLHNAGVRDYVGLDITDALFPVLRRDFPDYRFVQADICRGALAEQFDLLVMIDVIEHIVTESELDQATHHLSMLVRTNGLLLVSMPSPTSTLTRAFYLRFWPVAAVLSRFANWHIAANLAFRSGRLLALRKPSDAVAANPG
jgi:2-polyprenyl-3-methyl-5-hydroxy-6-metoxy-1,4-benzoquinol methylase